MDFKDLASRLGIDEEDFMELVELFITTSLADVEKLKKSVLENSCPDASAASHSIKGAAANMGFEEIAKLTTDMEMQAKQGNVDNFDVYIADLEKMVTALNNA